MDDMNYTRSLREQIKERRRELKELEEKSKKVREEKKAAQGKFKEARTTLVAQVQYILEERPDQAETASALMDGLFAKRELTEEFKAFLELFHEKRAAVKAKWDQKKADRKAAAEKAAEELS